jgi:cytochrome c peroxidase
MTSCAGTVMRVACIAVAVGLGGVVTLSLRTDSAAVADSAYPELAPLPQGKPADESMAELGRYLFFDSRLSGDWNLSCASCHDPAKGWADGEPLSKAYPASEYFRNAPTLYNARYRARFMWDGRLDGADLGTLVRDMVTEAHFMNADGRIVQERLKQVPEYVALWEKAFGKGTEPYGPRMFNAVGEFVKTIESRNVPFDRYLRGDHAAISEEAKAGLALFKDKAGCITCHNGPILSDGTSHKLGVPENPQVWADPLRAITMLRHYATSGMPNYMNARTDVGAYAISKDERDIGRFLTPSLRELKYTAPYMHNGMFKTLEDVMEFYSRGGGKGGELKPLGLTAAEKKALVAFLESLSGDPVTAAVPTLPELRPRTFGRN